MLALILVYLGISYAFTLSMGYLQANASSSEVNASHHEIYSILAVSAVVLQGFVSTVALAGTLRPSGGAPSARVPCCSCIPQFHAAVPSHSHTLELALRGRDVFMCTVSMQRHKQPRDMGRSGAGRWTHLAVSCLARAPGEAAQRRTGSSQRGAAVQNLQRARAMTAWQQPHCRAPSESPWGFRVLLQRRVSSFLKNARL